MAIRVDYNNKKNYKSIKNINNQTLKNYFFFLKKKIENRKGVAAKCLNESVKIFN
jgi:hypothetical protein